LFRTGVIRLSPLLPGKRQHSFGNCQSGKCHWRVSEKTGLPKEQARQVIDAVLDYLKDKLPEPFGVQINSLLEGNGAASSLGDIASNLGGFFGKK